MKKSVLFLAVIISSLLFTKTNAQVIEDNSDETQTSKQAISVYLVDSFEAAYQFGKAGGFYSKILVDLSLSGSDGTDDNYQDNFNSSDTTHYYNSNDNNGSSIGINLSYYFMYDLIKTKFVNLYCGFGPSTGYSYISSTSMSDSQNNTYFDSKTENTRSSYSLRAKAIIGLEVSFSENVFLFVESHLSGGKNWYENKNIYTSLNSDNNEIKSIHKQTGSTWSYSLTKILIGVGIYF